MAITTAALHKAVVDAWATANLDSEFSGYWPLADRSEYLALNDQEASPHQPFPFCVFEQQSMNVVDRMGGAVANTRYEIHDVAWQFRIHAQRDAETDQSAKTIAAALAAAVMAVFGGHPTEDPVALSLDSGQALTVMFESESPLRTGDDEYEWGISYLIRLDVPMRA